MTWFSVYDNFQQLLFLVVVSFIIVRGAVRGRHAPARGLSPWRRATPGIAILVFAGAARLVTDPQERTETLKASSDGKPLTPIADRHGKTEKREIDARQARVRT